jgi:hypothetical protein
MNLRISTEQDAQSGGPDVRYGSLADIAARIGDVRFAPKSSPARGGAELLDRRRSVAQSMLRAVAGVFAVDRYRARVNPLGKF